jgi:hypothetical protein
VECPIGRVVNSEEEGPAFLIAVSQLLIRVLIQWLLEKLKTLASLFGRIRRCCNDASKLATVRSNLRYGIFQLRINAKTHRLMIFSLLASADSPGGV